MLGLQEKIREPGEAERLFRLMDIDGICHSSFCGRLEARFPGRAILYTTCPGLELAKLENQGFFAPNCPQQTPFPFTFCFLPPVNSGGAVRAVFPRLERGTKAAPQTEQRFKSLSRKISASSVPSSGKTAQRNHLQQTEKEIVCGQVQVSPSSRAMQLPSSQQQHSGVSGWPPVSSAPVSCGKGNRPACVPAAASLIGVISHAFLHFSLCRSHRKGFLPHSCGVFRRWHAPRSFGTTCPK